MANSLKLFLIIGFISVGLGSYGQKNSSNLIWSPDKKLVCTDFKNTEHGRWVCNGDWGSCAKRIDSILLAKHYLKREEIVRKILASDTERCNIDSDDVCLGLNDTIYLKPKLFNKIFDVSDSFDKADNIPGLGGSALSIDIKLRDSDINEKNYEVLATFYPEKSYLLFLSDALLEHEQIHFDIYEVFARKIRKYMSEIITSTGRFSFVDPFYLKLLQEKQEENAEFDRESQLAHEHYNTEKFINTNVKWRKRLDKQLDSLKAYESKIVSNKSVR